MRVKYLKTLVFLVSLFSLSQVYAVDRIGRLGIGSSQSSASGLRTLSLKLQRSRSSSLGAYFGVNSEDGTTTYAAGGRLYRIIYDEPQLDFYSVLSLGMYTYEVDAGGSTDSGYELEGGLGTEFSFQGLESLGFSFEFGLRLYTQDSETNMGTFGHDIIKAAIHFYLQIMKKPLAFIFLALFTSKLALAQSDAVLSAMGEGEDLNIGGDIFSDFNEDLEAAQVMEDERFYRYGRFFAANIGIGYTTFTGNRGKAYPDSQSPPISWSLSMMYFSNFQVAYLIGLGYSSHVADINTKVRGSQSEILGTIQTTMLRPFVGTRYYIDTSDLGTAITYSNPYITGRLEYWYQTNRFIDSQNLPDKSGGAIGTALGGGLEFPMELKKSYFNVEVLYHFVQFFDENTADYQQIENDDESTYGYQSLRGDALTIMFHYNSSW